MGLACRHLELQSGGAHLTVCTRGAAMVALTVDGTPAVAPGPPGPCPPEQYRGTILAPWPNRSEPDYRFDGRDLHVPVNEPASGLALHGLVSHRDWNVLEASSEQAVLQLHLGDDPGYPFPLELTTTYAVDARGATGRVVATNDGSAPAPVGLGAHPYLSVGAPVDDTWLEVPADRYQPKDPRGLPAGDPADVGAAGLDYRHARPIGAAHLDHAFTELARDADGRARVRLSAGGRRTVMELGPTALWVLVYTSDTLDGPARRSAIAVEPMTCPPGGLAGGNLAVLDPHESLTLDWAIRVESASG